jgi:hypothetical protein
VRTINNVVWLYMFPSRDSCCLSADLLYADFTDKQEELTVFNGFNYRIIYSFYIVTRTSDYRRGFYWRLYLLTTLTHDLLATINYSAIADFHTLQITKAHTKSFQSAVSSLVVP